MKRIFVFFVIVALCSTANLQVFSQKIRTINSKKIPIIKNETPIIKNDIPTDVKLRTAEAYTDGSGVFIRWQTEYEYKNIGFYLYRAGAKGVEPVSQGLIAGGRATSSEDLVYGG